MAVVIIGEPLYTYPATIDRWVDADTVWAYVDIGFRIRGHFNFRLHGIDAPERYTPAGKAAAQIVNTLAPSGAPITIRSYKDPDNFGRWLARITTHDGTDIAKYLLESGIATPYRKAEKQ